jgi:16S rRNA (guanine527-N7)-methyltransferase
MAHKNSTNWSAYNARRKGKKSGHTGRHKKPIKIYEFNEADDRIFDVFRNHGFEDYPHEKRRQLVKFYEILMNNQKSQNFTRLTEIKDIALKHFIDSLMVRKLFKYPYPILDIGTGPGFPGIPLQIDDPEGQIMLAEGVQKRVEFLKQAREELELDQIKIFGRNIDPGFEYPVQSVITRAVEDMGNTLNNVKYSLQTGGYALFMKGPNLGPEIDQALERFPEHYEHYKTFEYELPSSPHQRTLVVFKKIKEFDHEDD